ncbi:hypothetical protein BGZ54_010419 [Gamsiella multidivaricata]|nr:hypothetical protein BGZ54_010419 [Gamsiella multidivaricata]
MPYVNRNVLYKRIHEAQSINHTHNDLESFEGLDHNTSSTIYRGTLFEYQTQEILKKHLGIYTQRSAGNGDLGIDLRGTWFLPLSASAEPGDMVRHLKVIVQCKKMSSKVGPKFVRELQGSLSYETQPTMAILAISSEFTKQALLPYAKSLWPMALVVIDTKKQECRKLMWNRAAEKVMHGLQVATRWYKGEDGQLESRPVLCFKGELIKRLPGPHLNEGKREADQDMESMETANTSPIDYSIPNWNINTKPEYLRIVPKATGGWDRADLEGEDADHPPLHSNHLELLSWSPPFPIQESIQPSTE